MNRYVKNKTPFFVSLSYHKHTAKVFCAEASCDYLFEIICAVICMYHECKIENPDAIHEPAMHYVRPKFFQ